MEKNSEEKMNLVRLVVNQQSKVIKQMVEHLKELQQNYAALEARVVKLENDNKTAAHSTGGLFDSIFGRGR